MLSRNVVFWEVDAQADFMLPGGKLYVPGAEKLLPNIRRLTDAARQGRVFLVSHGCYHTKDDPEFAIFPPHCVQGTPGANLVPEALTEKVVTVPNEAAASLPPDLSRYQQILLEKQTLNIFESRHADELVEAPWSQCRIRRVRRGHGILRTLRSQGSARARTPRLGSSGRNRNPEFRRWETGRCGTAGPRSHVHHHRTGTHTAGRGKMTSLLR